MNSISSRRSTQVVQHFVNVAISIMAFMGAVLIPLVLPGNAGGYSGWIQSTPEAAFGLPFAEPPGVNSWLLIQPFGNTVFAYRNRQTVYPAGQGLHFGVDFAARCGTAIVSIGDGTVAGIDVAQHGAGPHNLLINHDNGYVSLYGHLLERPGLRLGEQVARGQAIAKVGDPDLTCTSRPHLHLELRDSATRRYAYNPLPLIDAPWHSYALFGPNPVRFQQDSENPLQWVDLLDQPMITFGLELLNEYEASWPPSW